MKNNQRIISRTSKYNRKCLLIFILLFSAFPAAAEDTIEMQPTNFIRSSSIFGFPLLSIDENLAVGLGVAFATNPFKGVDDELMPFPEITYQNGNFYIDFSGIGYTVYSTDNCDITLLGSWRSAPYDSDDSSFLTGMEKRNFVVEAGVAATMETFIGDIGVVAMSDVTNNHQGQIVTVQYSVPFGYDSWVIEPAIGVNWQTKKMIGYYYGVRQSEVRDDRAFYDGKSDFSPYIALNSAVEIYDNVFLQASRYDYICYVSNPTGIGNYCLLDTSSNMQPSQLVRNAG